MFLILSNGIYWVNKILLIFSSFLQPYLLPKRQKKKESVQFLMLKFTVSVSNLYMKPIWATLEFFTSDNNHIELSLPIVHIFWPLMKKNVFQSSFSKTKWPPFSKKIKYFYFFCFCFCKIVLVSHHY